MSSGETIKVRKAFDARAWLRAGLSFFYPEICQICKETRATRDEGFVCGGCAAKVKLLVPPFCICCGRPVEGEVTTTFSCSNCEALEPSFSYARSAAITQDVLREIIHHYKYARALWYEPFLAGLLLRAAAPVLRTGKWDFIVPVPLHPVKQREREFNQAERLAKWLSRDTGIPLSTTLIRRVLPTRTQTQLSREERLENVKRAFAYCGGQRLEGERIVVIDDVMTTGATTNACARVLKQAGAGEVCVWTVARGT